MNLGYSGSIGEKDRSADYYGTRTINAGLRLSHAEPVDNFSAAQRPSTTYNRPRNSYQTNPWDVRETSRPSSKRFSLGWCTECRKPLSGVKWCNPCNAAHFNQQTSEWTSWRLALDNFIIRTQITAKNFHAFFEWIPFEDFDNITCLARGGYNPTFKAIWKQGPIIYWNTNVNAWERYSNQEVVLKVIRGSQKNLDEFINGLTAHHNFNTTAGNVLRCFGVSRWEDSEDFIVVTSCAEDGNLRQYIRKNSEKFSWIERLVTLKDIARTLEIIHNSGYVHRDLHPGNILRHGNWTVISDLGLTWSQDSVSTGEIFGVLPYIAPEVLAGGQYSSASDIYSFAMMMYEIVIGEMPFYNITQNVNPVYVIYGSRPEPPPTTPPCYIEIMNLCWDPDPRKRPNAGYLVRVFDDWIHSKTNNLDIIYNSFQSAELERRYSEYSNKNSNAYSADDYTYIDETYTGKLISIRDIVNYINQQRLQQNR